MQLPPIAEHVSPDELQPNFVKDMIDRVDAVPERSRLGRGGAIHVSSLVDLCPRQYYLAHEHGTEDYVDHLGRRLTGGLLVTFAIGRAIDTFIKERVVRATRRQGMYGMWVCPCRHTRRLGMYVPTQCQRCDRAVDIYNEPILRNEEYRIIGRPDITLVDTNNHYLPVEVKSMARDRWDSLEEPLADHVLQALLYRWMYEQEGRRVHDHVVLLYVTKDFRYGSPYKEFHIHHMDPRAMAGVSLALHLAAQIRDARAAGVAPERTLCDNATCARARNCPVQALCFNME